MSRLRCMIIEDEPLAAEILQDYIKEFPFLELIGVAGNAMDAAEVLRNNSVDIIFLDIHLPKVKGIDFLKTLKSPPAVIVTSAYQEYALDGFALNVVDYLLKPIEFNRFMMAINKITARMQLKTPSSASDKPHLFFNVSKQRVKVYTDDILYIESQKEYVKIVTANKSIITKLLLAQMEEMLDPNDFIRVHRSFIVSKRRVEAVSATELHIASKEIPIGRSYKEFVLAHFPSAN